MYICTSGTKDWRMMISDKNNGPWTIIANGSFPDPRLTQWNVPLTVVTLTGYDIPAGQVSNTSSVNPVYQRENQLSLFVNVCEVLLFDEVEFHLI